MRIGLMNKYKLAGRGGFPIIATFIKLKRTIVRIDWTTGSKIDSRFPTYHPELSGP